MDRLSASKIMEDKKIVTIDLGTQSLKICVAHKSDDGKNEVIYCNDFPSAGIGHGKVMNTNKLSNAIRNAMDSVEKVAGIKVNQVMVPIQKYDIRESEHSFKITLDPNTCISEENVKVLGDMLWNEVSSSLVEKNEEVFGIVPQSFTTDDEMNVGVNDIVGMMTENFTGRYKVYTGKKSSRNYIDAAMANAGISTVRSVFNPEDIGEAVLTDSEMDGGVALIDFGAGATSISIFYAGALRHYGAIPFGGNSITDDIKNVCGIPEKLAENIKLGYGGCMPDRLLSLGEKKLRIISKENGSKTDVAIKYLSEIITARMKEIIEAMLYEIEKSGYKDNLKNGVVIVGGGANMLNLCTFIKELSGYTARIGSPQKNHFKSDSSTIFFNPGNAESAGLVECFIKEDVSCVTETERKAAGEPKVEKIPVDIFAGDGKETDNTGKDDDDDIGHVSDVNPFDKLRKKIFGSDKKSRTKETPKDEENLFNNVADEDDSLDKPAPDPIKKETPRTEKKETTAQETSGSGNRKKGKKSIQDDAADLFSNFADWIKGENEEDPDDLL